MTDHTAADAAIEQKIQDLGLTAPRITQEQIEKLAERVQFVGGAFDGTTTTVIHAFLDGTFYLGSAHSACVSPENFNAELGMEIASKKLSAQVWDKLWELEGWRLYREMNPD